MGGMGAMGGLGQMGGMGQMGGGMGQMGGGMGQMGGGMGAMGGSNTASMGAHNPNVENMRVELRDMTSQRDTAQAELRERDARIQRLLSELQGLVFVYFNLKHSTSSINLLSVQVIELAKPQFASLIPVFCSSHPVFFITILGLVGG